MRLLIWMTWRVNCFVTCGHNLLEQTSSKVWTTPSHPGSAIVYISSDSVSPFHCLLPSSKLTSACSPEPVWSRAVLHILLPVIMALSAECWQSALPTERRSYNLEVPGLPDQIPDSSGFYTRCALFLAQAAWWILTGTLGTCPMCFAASACTKRIVL